jgi:hypothetical protein
VNAPVRIQPARDRYIPVVTHHVPLCEGRELVLRCSILLLRDQATSALRRCSDEAAGVMGEVERLATLFAFKRMPVARLEELRGQLLRMTAVGSGLDMFAYQLAYPDGGANAGG